jgi:hypothetical protein
VQHKLGKNPWQWSIVKYLHDMKELVIRGGESVITLNIQGVLDYVL